MLTKKLLLFTAFFLLAIASHSTVQGATFTTGLQGGYGHGHSETTSDYKSHNFNPTPVERNSGAHGLLGGLFFGADFKIWEKCIIGLEANGFLSSMKAKENFATSTNPAATTDTIKQKLKSSLDLLLKLAYQLDPIALYFKAGPSYGRWQFQSAAGAVPLDYSKTKGLWGAKVAFGVEGDMVDASR